MRISCWLLLPVAFVAATVQAQPAAEERVLCISHWPGWEATAAEIAVIETVPVPDSFRAWARDNQICARFPVVTQTLIDWHLAFGSGTSVAAALAYLESEEMRDLPAPEDYARALQRARRGALPDPRRARASERMPAPSLERLRLLIEGLERFLVLAEQASRAAEEFDSLSLPARDQRHLRAAEAGAAFVAALETPLEHLLPSDPPTDRIAEIRLRDALLRARLTGAAADRERAEALVDAAERPAYRELIGPAFSGGSDFCEIGDFLRNAAALEALCTADEQMQEHAVSWAVARSMLLLLRGHAGEEEDARRIRRVSSQSRNGRGRRTLLPP